MPKEHDEEEDLEDEDLKDEAPEDTDADDSDEDDEADEDLKDDDIDKDNDVKSLKEKLKKATEAKRQLTARARRAEKASKTKNPASPHTKTNQERRAGSEPLEKRLSAIETIESKRQFGHMHGLSPEETDLAFRFANGKPTKKTLSDPFFKAGLDGIRTAKKIAANTPGSSRRSNSFSTKPFSELTKEERKAAHTARMDSIRRS